MASRTGQFQLYRRISAGLLVGLGLALAAPVAHGLPEVPASGYQTQSGVPFFILSDRSYGSDEIAQLRLETTRDGSGALLSGNAGVDLTIYRVAKPLDFLRSQRNLHRVAGKAIHVGDGARQTLNYLYDSWTKQTRRSWQRILATPARKTTTERYPRLSMGKYPSKPTTFAQDIQFKPIPGMRLETRIRYPMWAAKPIAPPKDLKLEGSSSDFIRANPGNVMIPLGKLKPGLYLVEAMFGSHRANSLLFVSDTVAVTKTAGEQMFVWAAQRRGGTPVANAKVAWTDGVGVLGSGETDASGVFAMRRVSPEKSYVVGVDPQGGVFVSENFYYDSEIYNAKLYAITDRPLYRPGDTVRVKFLGRQFRDARRSEQIPDTTLKLRVNDPNGSPLLSKDVVFSGRDGGDTQFTLPANAPAGGWELRFDLGEDRYGAAFRVAEYVKPHFDIHVNFGRANIKSGEAIAGQIRLTYPNGKPVKQGSVSMSVRAQRVTMVEGELNYAGLFPVTLEQFEMTTDEYGIAPFKLPAAAQPSRYIVTVLANDGAAYRVKVTRELLIERGINPWRVSAPRRFSPPGDNVTFQLQGEGKLVGATWEVVRLESRTRTQGTLKDGTDKLTVAFEHPGSYAVNLHDAQGNLLGAANHWVTGKGVKTAPGSIEIVTDKERYAPGESAEVLITFSDATENALVTLERDTVERHALLGRSADWIAESTRVADNQWRLKIPIGETMTPNITLSVSRVKAGEHIFQNAGLVVVQPTLDIAVRADKEIYRPGETARLDFTGSYQGKPVEALLNVAVVDEMVYVLQPELAPSIVDFFYHLRRNNVRTGSSLAFIGYDLARDYAGDGMRRQTRNERAVKILERPRRDEIDTAAWFPSIRTDKNGRASVSFKIPDSLTRWRITTRGLTADGQAGQRTAYIRSEKPLYLKWAGPRHFRDGDEPIIDLVGFNRGDKPVAATLRTAFGANSTQRQVTLNPGPNYFTLPLLSAHRGILKLELQSGGKSLDGIEVKLSSRPVAWPSARQINARLLTTATDISLPADARDIQLSLLGGGTEYFAQVVDDLIEYPYGCVEQTSSRLIPLALAHEVLGKTRGAERLRQLLQAQRARLVRLAGGDGVFGWWGRASSESAFLTGYAYYADSFAARALGIQLPAGHAENLLKVYSQHADQEPILHRAMVLWWAQRLGLPVQGLAIGLAEHLTRLGESSAIQLQDSDSLVFAAPDSRRGLQVAAVLLDTVARRGGFRLGADTQKRVAEARQALAGVAQPFVQALLRLGDNKTQPWTSDMLLYRVSAEAPTFERAMTLAWVQESLGGFGNKGSVDALQPLGWVPGIGDMGNAGWRWTAAKPPTRISLARPPQSPVTAALRYTSHAAEVPRLAVAVQRRLYRLAPSSGSLAFKAVPVAANEALSPTALYVDEVTLVPKTGQRFHYGMLEVPLPPGAGVEGTTWGIHVEGLGVDVEAATLSAPEHEMGEMDYRVPIENLDKPLVTRQLLRFQQRGRFKLPPARYFRMYQPGDKALESQGAALWRVE